MTAPRRSAAFVWATVGVAVLLLEAIVRMGSRTASVFAEASASAWLVLVVASVAFAYGEGYRALHLHFVPSVVARARRIGAAPPWCIALGPLYAMSLVGAPPRVLARAWAAVAAIVACALAVASLPDPWRGVVDGAVALALAIGLASLIVRMLRVP